MSMAQKELQIDQPRRHGRRRSERSLTLQRLGQAVQNSLPNTPTKTTLSYERFLKGVK